MLSFNPKVTGYTVSVAYGTTAVPVITATAEEDCNVVIEQSDSFDKPTLITVSRKDEPDVERKYTISYTVLPKLEDVEGWKRLQVTAHNASDEPGGRAPGVAGFQQRYLRGFPLGSGRQAVDPA